VPVNAVVENLRESFRILARHSPRGEVREYGGVSIASAGVAFQMFNAAFLSSPVENQADLERRLAQCAVHFGARGLGWALWLCQDWIPQPLRRRLRPSFQSRQLRHAVDLPGMVSEGLLPPHDPEPRLEIRRVRGGAVREDFCAVGSACFGVPLNWFREVFSGEGVWDEFASWVAYEDGKPVATAAAVTAAGAIGLYNIGTLPAYQRRGYGEAMTRHAFEEARRACGFERSILQSTAQGFRLYQRLGYRTVTTVSVYAS
jgi:GNAT superfamily N-acetyltransferase